MSSSQPTARVHFAVDVEDMEPSEFVLVTGSTSSLGNWDPLKAKTLTQDAARPSVSFLFNAILLTFMIFL